MRACCKSVIYQIKIHVCHVYLITFSTYHGCFFLYGFDTLDETKHHFNTWVGGHASKSYPVDDVPHVIVNHIPMVLLKPLVGGACKTGDGDDTRILMPFTKKST